MEQILEAAVSRGASDIHIKAGDVFRARIDGQLVPLTRQSLTPDETREIALHVIADAQVRARIDDIRDYDCSWGAPGVGRFRVSILRQRSSFMIVMRVIPFEVPTFERLGLPASLAGVAETERGMVLITGAAGSGRSSTMAAIVHHINAHSYRHIVTLEDPIEFLHRDLRGSVTQREIGTDTDDLRTGLRAALRHDPDVVMLGEMRDATAIDTAMRVAETGRLVIAAFHAPDAASTVAQLVALFPPDEEPMARRLLAASLAAVVSQRLVPRADGHGRTAAVEVLPVTPAIREAIAAGRWWTHDASGVMAAARNEPALATVRA